MAETIDKTTLFNFIWPVNSIFTTTKSGDAGNPNILFTGTWEQITDVFLMSSNPSTSLPAGSLQHRHTIAGTKLTINQMPKHTHTVTISNAGSHIHTKLGTYGAASGSDTQIVANSRLTEDPNESFGLQPAGNHRHEFAISYAGNYEKHGHGDYTDYSTMLPNYYAVYVWKRVK